MRPSCLKVYCCAVTILLHSGVHCNLSKGDECSLRDGTKGYCEIISKCNSAKEMLANRRGAPVNCGFEGNLPIVCCSDLRSRLGVDPVAISDEKCRQYSDLVYVSEEVGLLLLDSVTRRTAVCSQDHVPLIIDGVKVAVSEFPHMAALGYEGVGNKVEWKCGGSLISEQYVLTAAHCDRGIKWVRLGDINVKDAADDKPFTQQYRVKRVVRHPDYKFSSYYNDIALVELEQSVTFSTSVRPACLHNNSDVPVAKVGTVTGWGVTSYTDEEGSDVLLKASIKVTTPEACNNSYKHIGKKLDKGFVSAKQICAGDPVGSRDTCVGDSGGPLQLIMGKPYCMYSLVGLTSFGSIACGEFNTPAVYTRVSHYIPWIQTIVWP